MAHEESELADIMSANSRICLLPRQWEELWRMLPGKRRVGGTWTPRVPPIGGDWWGTTREQKRLRFQDHVRYGCQNGGTKAIMAFLSSLREDEWLHEGDAPIP